MSRPHHPRLAAAIGDVRASLRAVFGPSPGAHLVVAVSGGRDSVAMLALLECCARGDSLTLDVLSFDHGLRPESAAETRRVVAQADRLGLRCAVRRLEIRPGPNLAERARDARRAAALAYRDELGADAIALGHTSTDRAETLLMHLARGTGLDGLGSMPQWDPPWLRPVLGLTRAETGEVCQRLGLGFVDDPTNADREAPRGRIRHAVLPELRQLNPRAESALAAAADVARSSEAALRWWVDREFDERRQCDPDGRPSWTLEGVNGWPRALRTRWLRAICRTAVPAASLGRRVVADIDAALMADARDGGGVRPRSWNLAAGARVSVGAGRIWVETGF